MTTKRTLARTVLLSLVIPGSALKLPVPAVHQRPRLGVGSAGPIHSSFDPLGLRDLRLSSSFLAPSAAALAGASQLLLCVSRADAAPVNFDAETIKNAITQAALVRRGCAAHLAPSATHGHKLENDRLLVRVAAFG